MHCSIFGVGIVGFVQELYYLFIRTNPAINLNFQLNQSIRIAEFGEVIYNMLAVSVLGRETHICVSKLNIIGSDNG